MTPIEIELTNIEAAMAAMVGVARQHGAVEGGKSSFGGPLRVDREYGIHVIGALGEMAAAKALGVYFDATVGTFKSRPDLEGIEVRTRTNHDWDLLVRDNDDPEAVFLLVTGDTRAFKVWGWAYGHEAMQDRYVQTYGGRRPAFFMPKADLHPLQELP